jgi:hypothetical protein
MSDFFFGLGIIENKYFLTLDKNSTKFRLPKPVYVTIENVPKKENKGLNENKHSLTSNKGIESRPRNATDYEKGHADLCKNSWQEDYTNLHQHLIETNKNKFNIYTCSGGGWGNRLRDLLTSFHFAVVAKRAFIINCNNPSPLDRFLAPRYIKWNYKVNETQLTVRRRYQVKLNDIENPSDPKIYEQMLNYSMEYDPGMVGNKYPFFASLLKYDLPVWPNIPQMLGCSFYYLFKKSDMLQKRLEEWKEKLGFNQNIVIGIHIRQGDSVFLHHNSQDKKFKNSKDIDLGLDCALQIQKEIKKKYKTDNIVWFLAADSEKMKTRAKQKYGDKVRSITGPIEHVAHPSKGNEDAGHLSMFLDYFLLQNADYRLYLGGSTFDNAIDFITLGSQNAARCFSHRTPSHCVIPPSLKA